VKNVYTTCLLTILQLTIIFEISMISYVIMIWYRRLTVTHMEQNLFWKEGMLNFAARCPLIGDIYCYKMELSAWWEINGHSLKMFLKLWLILLHIDHEGYNYEHTYVTGSSSVSGSISSPYVDNSFNKSVITKQGQMQLILTPVLVRWRESCFEGIYIIHNWFHGFHIIKWSK
jgi:hypothetical protein